MPHLVQQYFQRSAERFPDKIAVTCGTDSTTYRDLDLYSNALARELRRRGVGRGAYVPFFMQKSVHSMRALLAILKADCAYVPLDVGSPRTGSFCCRRRAAAIAWPGSPIPSPYRLTDLGDCRKA